MFVGLLAIDRIDSEANEARKQRFKVGKIRGLCAASVRIWNRPFSAILSTMPALPARPLRHPLDPEEAARAVGAAAGEGEAKREGAKR
jgi:hypothetical protein